jgi:uncharacterized caspase-like protein
MKTRKIVLFVLIACILNTGALHSSQTQNNQEQDKTVIKRFAMAVGADNGGKDRVLLQYAVSDAQAILNVFEELGGVEEEDVLLLEEPDVRAFYTEMGKLQSRIEKSKADYSRVEFIFYYSGHSDDKYILLGDEKISYENLRDTINSIDADVRIAILDSCASGAFTRIKGGKKRLPFLMDSAYDMRGFAVMTSSSANEASQESDLIQSSFFTHYLISGMRGAADMSQDGRITMNEAYQFAFNETLAQTTKTISGPQHPYTDIRMSGTGDVVMTDVRRASVILTLGEEIFGQIFIHDRDDRLVVELTKPPGRKIELGLEEGEYRVINIPEGGVFESTIKLEDGEEYELTPSEFAETDVEYTTPRGRRAEQIDKHTVLEGKSTYRVFGELGSKSTEIDGEYGLLMGGSLGVTINRVFSVGFAGYGKANFDPGLPGYGGLFFAYNFSPIRKLHLRATTLVGSGTSHFGNIFYIFEPGVEGVLNISQVVRLTFGLSVPLTDKNNTGMEKASLNIGFQFGK